MRNSKQQQDYGSQELHRHRCAQIRHQFRAGGNVFKTALDLVPIRRNTEGKTD